MAMKECMHSPKKVACTTGQWERKKKGKDGPAWAWFNAFGYLHVSGNKIRAFTHVLASLVSMVSLGVLNALAMCYVFNSRMDKRGSGEGGESSWLPNDFST